MPAGDFKGLWGGLLDPVMSSFTESQSPLTIISSQKSPSGMRHNCSTLVHNLGLFRFLLEAINYGKQK